MAKATNQSTDLTSAGFLKGLEILLEGPDKDLYKVGKPVPAQDADRCKKQFEELMDVEDHHDLVYFRFKRSDTLSVTFTGKDLLDWLKEMIALGPGVVNNIRVTFGIYDADFARTHNPGKTDRLSVFLWPYINDKPAKKPGASAAEPEDLPPYNLGGLQP